MPGDTAFVVSYAQNREDVLLWRAFKDILPSDGFWIDVGANDPVVDSVTKLFSVKGWRGINVEPVRRCYDALVKDRPNDINLRMAVGNVSGGLIFHHIPEQDTLSTFDDRLAEKYRERGLNVVDEPIPVLTLAEIWQRHVKSPVHFLKIDVEGHEAAVVEGMNWRQFRPMVLMIEATYPERWRQTLEGNGYRFVLDDGINFVFVAEEYPDLVRVLSRPVIAVFDSHVEANHYSQFLRSMGATAIADNMLSSAGLSNNLSAVAGARALADVICLRPDLVHVFAPDGRVDHAAALRWATEITVEQDSHIARLAPHREGLLKLKANLA